MNESLYASTFHANMMYDLIGDSTISTIITMSGYHQATKTKSEKLVTHSHQRPSMQMHSQSTICQLALPGTHFPKEVEKMGLPTCRKAVRCS